MGPITVRGLFRRHLPVLAGLPGENSQFDQSQFGYEWRCEFNISASDTGEAPKSPENPLHLHFSLIDIDRQGRPAAALYLVEQLAGQSSPVRLMLPLEDLGETHEQLNKQLDQRQTSVAVYQNASRFIKSLSRVRKSLGTEATWA
jgi:hypothetical protein